MDDFVAHYSRARLALLLLGAAIFVAAGLWMVGLFGTPPSSHRYSPAAVTTAGWLCIAFFGLAAVIIAKRLVEGGEALRIGRVGISFTAWSDQTIPWSEITEISEWSMRGQRSIILHLRDPDRFPGSGALGLTAKANRAMTGGDIPISLNGTDRSFDEAVAAIGQFSRAASPR
ncbi:MAG: STM3941 family protein [Novosphingobium sp.]